MPSKRIVDCICCKRTGRHQGRGLIVTCYFRHRSAGTLDRYPLLGHPHKDRTPWIPVRPHALGRLEDYRFLITEGVTDKGVLAQRLGMGVRQVIWYANADRATRPPLESPEEKAISA